MVLAIDVVRTDTGDRETFTCASSPVRIGRSPLNNVVLAAPWVSLHHGLIHFEDHRANYSDLGSTNGTVVMVNDQEMKLHPMVPMEILGGGQGGAELRIGVITLHVRWGEAAARTPNDKRGYETRLTMGDGKNVRQELLNARGPTASAGVPAYSAGVTRYAAPGEAPPEVRPTGMPAGHAGTSPRATGGNVGAPPVYQAGMTRMVMPGEEPGLANLREARPTAAGASSQGAVVSTPMPSMTSGPLPDALARLSRSWAPTGASPLTLQGPDRVFAETLAAVADAFARGLVELKNGLKEFGEGIGVRAVGGHSPLHRGQTATEILNYLLDPNANTRERLEQLVDLFADLMIHEVALLSGVKAGVRQLLVEIGPEGGYAQSEGGKSIGLLDRSLRRYADFFTAATEDDGESVVFGPEFAKAYAAALGFDRAKPPRR